jgi:hypothetical protein
MAINLLQPTGLQLDRNALGLAPNYQGKLYTILKGYGSNIGKGDIVKWGTGSSQGRIVLALPTDTNILGVFNAVLPYYDTSLQGISHGLNGSYQSSSNPSADVQCLVYDDPFATFIAQVSGGPWVQTWQGQNINFVAAVGTTSGNGNPNISGISTVALDGTTVNVTNTLPFQIIGTVGVSGGPQDPGNTNPWIEVRMNTAQMLATTGV